MPYDSISSIDCLVVTVFTMEIFAPGILTTTLPAWLHTKDSTSLTITILTKHVVPFVPIMSLITCVAHVVFVTIETSFATIFAGRAFTKMAYHHFSTGLA